MSPRLAGLVHIARQQPYEGALAFAMALSAGWSLSGASGSSGLLGRVLTRWQVDAADVMLITGGVLTLAGLFTVGVADDAVRRVLARRVEQAGQVLMGGVLLALAAAAASLGRAGIVGVLVYGALALAAGLRSVLVGRLVRGSGMERTEVAG